MEQVEQIVFDASYLVLGLGDVYLGAPGDAVIESPSYDQVQSCPNLDR